MQNAFIESFNGRLRDEFLNETLFTSLMQARLALEEWRRDYNTVRPHSRIGWLTPAAYAATVLHRNGAKALRYRWRTASNYCGQVRFGRLCQPRRYGVKPSTLEFATLRSGALLQDCNQALQIAADLS